VITFDQVYRFWLLVGGLEHVLFSIIYWDVILPLNYVSRWLKHVKTTNQPGVLLKNWVMSVGKGWF